MDPDFDADFEYEYVDGHANRELVFNHKPSKALIEADLLFNLPATEQFSKSGQSPTGGILTSLFMPFWTTHGAAMGQRRFVWYATSSPNRTSFNKSVKRIAGWDFEKLIPCHGEVVEEGGKGVFEKVMQWNIEAAQSGK